MLCVAVILSAIVAAASGADCDFLFDTYPKSYVNFFTKTAPVMDGRLDDAVWQEVAFTDDFIDIQGSPPQPKPRFRTRAKMRFDDTFLYVGAHIDEPQIWANETEHNSVIFNDNDFEVFINPDGSCHYYKEYEMNARNTTWDLCLNQPYMNGGYANSSWEMPSMKSAVYIDGRLNDPSAHNVFWSVEIAFPLADLALNNSVAVPPREGDRWRINFSRVEWHVNVIDGNYVKVKDEPEDNWTWSSQYAINMHIPERFGYLIFARGPVNSTKATRDPQWPVRRILAEIYSAQRAYSAIQGYFTPNIEDLHLDPRLYDGSCAHKPDMSNVQSYKFDISVRSYDDNVGTGSITDTRYLTFLDN